MSLDLPSYKVDLDFWDCFGMEKTLSCNLINTEGHACIRLLLQEQFDLNLHCLHSWIDVEMYWDFTPILTVHVFQSKRGWEDGNKGCVQWNHIYGWIDFCWWESNPRPLDQQASA